MTSGHDVVVAAHGVSKQWPEGVGLRPLDLRIEPGTVTCLKGRSGSGKSTLLALLMGWAEPDAGSLTWATALDADARSQWSALALVPQSLLLLPELSVLENVA